MTNAAPDSSPSAAAAGRLLEVGAKLNAFQGRLHAAALRRAQQSLRDREVPVGEGRQRNDRLPDGTSALSLAILNADFDLAALLLDGGADPNVPDPRGHPVHVVAWLHQPGAPPDFAMNGEAPEPVPRPRGTLSHVDIAKLLLDKGADPNVTITWGQPASAAAVWRAVLPI